jgi:adenine-specific DNA-methyltransferase
MTELMWEGKYDADGRRVAPLRVALPFQTVETVNEAGQQRQRALDLLSEGRDPEWRHRLTELPGASLAVPVGVE